MKLTLLVLAPVFLCGLAQNAGCAGRNFSTDGARGIRPGMTETEVEALMRSKPLATEVRGGVTRSSWAYVRMFAAESSKQVVVEFDGDGRVVEAPVVP
jgi:hypothetical protein